MTLPSFCFTGDTQNLWVDSKSTTGASSDNICIVIKAPQKAELANWTLPLCHNLSTGWTNAVICGRGFTVDEDPCRVLGTQFAQLIDAILERPSSWGSAFLLPFCLLQNYLERLDSRSEEIDQTSIGLESEIGVTLTAAVDDKREVFRQAQNLDSRTTTVKIHTASTQILYLCACCEWLSSFPSFLIKSAKQLERDARLELYNISLQDLIQDVEFQQYTAGALQSRFQTFKDRASLQTNVLFNIISQRANDISQRDAQLNVMMTKSSKQDNISMTTFTFLTALYLPATSVVTMFSMGMFNWQGDSGSDDTAPYVAGNFWIFWVVTVPLTVVTMASWYCWSCYANSVWLKQIDNSAAAHQLDTDILQSLQQDFTRLKNIREGDTHTLNGLKLRKNDSMG